MFCFVSCFLLLVIINVPILTIQAQCNDLKYIYLTICHNYYTIHLKLFHLLIFNKHLSVLESPTFSNCVNYFVNFKLSFFHYFS